MTTAIEKVILRRIFFLKKKDSERSEKWKPEEYNRKQKNEIEKAM